MAVRLQEALGVTEEEIQSCRERVTLKQWSLVDVAKALEDRLIGKDSGAPCSLTEYTRSEHPKGCPEDGVQEANPVLLYLSTGVQPAWTQRPCWEGRPGHSAMKPRLRKQGSWRKQPLPTLKWPCRMCEAEFPNVGMLDKHIDLLHGQYRFYSTWLGGVYSQCPYVVNSTEKSDCVLHFAAVQQHDTSVAEDEPYVELQNQAMQRKQLLVYLYELVLMQRTRPPRQRKSSKLKFGPVKAHRHWQSQTSMLESTRKRMKAAISWRVFSAPCFIGQSISHDFTSLDQNVLCKTQPP